MKPRVSLFFLLDWFPLSFPDWMFKELCELSTGHVLMFVYQKLQKIKKKGKKKKMARRDDGTKTVKLTISPLMDKQTNWRDDIRKWVMTIFILIQLRGEFVCLFVGSSIFVFSINLSIRP